jgi:hypothetical protein
MTDLQPQRPTQEERQNVRGLSALSDSHFARILEDAQEQRKQEREYWDSLPSEPKEALAAVGRLLNHDGSGYPVRFERAMHMAHVVQMAVDNQEISQGPELDAVRFVMLEVVHDLLEVGKIIERAGDICRKPHRGWMSEAAEAAE